VDVLTLPWKLDIMRQKSVKKKYGPCSSVSRPFIFINGYHFVYIDTQKVNRFVNTTSCAMLLYQSRTFESFHQNLDVYITNISLYPFMPNVIILNKHKLVKQVNLISFVLGSFWLNGRNRIIPSVFCLTSTSKWENWGKKK
jgi:hypothetical protein